MSPSLATTTALTFCLGALAIQGHRNAEPVGAPCGPADLKRLLEPALFESFFHCVDSMRKVQYPDGDQDTTLSVDITRPVLRRFLEDLDYATLSATGEAAMEFQFLIAPKELTDPPACKDKVSVRFYPARCYFRFVVSSHFLVPPNWCNGGDVVYGCILGKDRVFDFYRDEAG